MHEIIVNTHVHSYLSDGNATYQGIADAAIHSGIDAVIITDHNVHIQRKEGFFRSGNKTVLILSGQEIHDRTRYPQKNHLLVFNPAMDYSSSAQDLVLLINKVRSTGALSFLAHPIDPELKAIGEPDISWEDWNIHGFTGIELWNGFSEIKYRSHNLLQTIFFAFFPRFLARQPLPEALKLWDDLLQNSPPCVAIGGSDAHALNKKALFWRKTVFPYDYHFSAINNHLLLSKPLSPNFMDAKSQIYSAFKNGSLFIGYDLPAPTGGFRFYGQGINRTVRMGESVTCGDGITFQISLPFTAECNLLRNGLVEKRWTDSRQCTYITNNPGVYRVEIYIHYLGSRRGWIFSNPIYVE
jgi:hypothetical protein